MKKPPDSEAWGLESRYHQVEFDASKMASGLYYVQLRFGEQIQLKKMLLVK